MLIAREGRLSDLHLRVLSIEHATHAYSAYAQEANMSKNTKSKKAKKPAAKPVETKKVETKKPEAAKPEKGASAPAAERYKKINTKATVPGIGEIDITLIEVRFRDEIHRAPTKKACAAWYREMAAIANEEVKKEREAVKAEKLAERIAKLGPAITGLLDKMAANLGTYAASPAIDNDSQRAALQNAVTLIRDVVAAREANDAK